MGEHEFVKRFPIYTSNMETYWYSLAKWLDSKGAIIISASNGQINLALDDKKFNKLCKELFGKEEKSVTKNTTKKEV